MSLKALVSNYILSRLDIEYFKNLARNNKILNPIYRIIAQSFIDRDFPKHIFIETTSLCNLKCKTCTRIKDKNKNGHMTMEVFKKIIDESTNYGPRSFCLHLFGEPLLQPNLIEMIKYIKKANPNHTVLLTTNGLLMTEKMFSDLIESKVDRITISLLAVNNETYHKITSSNRFQMLEDRLLYLEKKFRKESIKGTKVYLRYLVSDDTVEELKSFQKKWIGKSFIMEIRPCHNLGGQYEGTNISKNVFKHRWPCYHLWFGPGITYNGDFTICCNDPKRQGIIGNIKDKSIAEIWQSQKLKEIRQDHMEGQNYNKMSICEKCDVWSVYPDIFFDWQKKKKN